MKREIMIALLVSVAIMMSQTSIFADSQSGTVQSLDCMPVIPEYETLYLTDSADSQDGITMVYEVSLDPYSHRANLYPLPAANLDPPLGPGVIPFNQADAMAATPDGKRLYFVDRYDGGDTGHLGYYELATAEWVDLGQVTLDGDPLPLIVLAAFTEGGSLYVASSETDSLYFLRHTTASLINFGVIKRDGPTGPVVNVQGADMVFGKKGNLYLWSNLGKDGAPRGLYSLQLPPVAPAAPGTIVATYLGTSTDSFFTGLTTLPDYTDYLVGSTRQDEVWIMNRFNGQVVGPPFMMYRDGIPYAYEWGDMTTGKSVLCTLTIDYWKDHSWEGETVTICDKVVDEALGQEIMWNSSADDFSMLIAQLTAAKLNCGACRFEWVLRYAETWLCSQPGIATPAGDLAWDMSFQSVRQKNVADWLWTRLNCFNNHFECE